MKLLIAEDDPDMQKILKLYLQREGCQVKRRKAIRISASFMALRLFIRGENSLFPLMNTVCSYLSLLLKREDFWDPSVFTQHSAAMTDRMVREVLYNVPPLYHLDAAEWKRYQKDIAAYHTVWSEFSRKAVLQEMTDFKYLTEDGAVQKTVYGENIAAVANFSDEAYEFEGNSIPGYSVRIQIGGKSTIYTPSLQLDNA